MDIYWFIYALMVVVFGLSEVTKGHYLGTIFIGFLAALANNELRNRTTKIAHWQATVFYIFTDTTLISMMLWWIGMTIIELRQWWQHG